MKYQESGEHVPAGRPWGQGRANISQNQVFSESRSAISYRLCKTNYVVYESQNCLVVTLYVCLCMIKFVLVCKFLHLAVQIDYILHDIIKMVKICYLCKKGEIVHDKKMSGLFCTGCGECFELGAFTDEVQFREDERGRYTAIGTTYNVEKGFVNR